VVRVRGRIYDCGEGERKGLRDGTEKERITVRVKGFMKWG